jgi:hypothetical protein
LRRKLNSQGKFYHRDERCRGAARKNTVYHRDERYRGAARKNTVYHRDTEAQRSCKEGCSLPQRHRHNISTNAQFVFSSKILRSKMKCQV